MNKKIFSTLLLALQFACFSVLNAATLYVKPSSSSSAWASMAPVYNDLHAALLAASSGDEIWIASGTYKPSLGTDKTISFNLKSGVAIYGGFVGTETLLSQRNWVNNPTILSGNIGNPMLNTDNSQNVIKVLGMSANQADSIIFDGLIVEDGSSDRYGAGAYLEYANLTVANTIFRNNFAGGGGAIYADYCNITFANTLFLNSTAHYKGGAIFSSYSQLIFSHCLFFNNRSEFEDGVIFNFFSSVKITNSIAWDNRANNGAQHFSSASCTYSCIEGGYSGVGNISSNPMFVDAANGDYRLIESSPCIDMGLNSETPTWLTTDFYGYSRVVGAPVSMGIYEDVGILAPLIKSPSNYSVLASNSTSVALVWEWPSNQPSGITSYEIEIQTNDGVSQLRVSASTYFTLNNLASGSFLKWRVRGIDGSSSKNWSMWSSFSIPHSGPIFVKPAGTGNGLSWSSALGLIQSAIDISVYGDTIWVATGTYKPTSGTDRNASFNLKNGVAIFGGFTGNETQLSQRNWVENPTILSGEIGNAALANDNSYVIIKAIGTGHAPFDSKTRLDGLVIENGYNDGGGDGGNGTGGGAYFRFANLNVVNTVFRNNFAKNKGGAIYAQSSSACFANTLFWKCRSGGYAELSNRNHLMTFINCTFFDSPSAIVADNVKITNSIIWHSSLASSLQGTLDVTYSCVEGGQKGTGNISSDPLIVDAVNGDFRLNAGSTCINMGLNTETPSWLKIDYYGNPRVSGANVEMGIYEGEGVSTPVTISPTNNSAIPGSLTSVVLQWEWPSALPSGITGYEIEIQVNGGPSSLVTTGSTSYPLTNIAQASIYKWRVRGFDGTSFKNWSPWATFFVKHASPLFVKQGGTGNGLSWDSAMGSLQAAIDAAVYGDEIWVAQGIYKPTSISDRNSSFNLKNGVAIYGGFLGNETLLSQRNWVQYPTVLSGEIGNPDIINDNSITVIKAIGTAITPLDSTTRMDGIIVEKAHSVGESIGVFTKGRSAWLHYANITVANTIFRNNYGILNGGAVYIEEGKPVFVNTIFINNIASNSGGAVESYGSQAVFSQCAFLNNQAGIDDVAVSSVLKDVIIINSIIWGNNAGRNYQSNNFINCSYSCVEGGIMGIGNISSNPLFVDAANGDCRLKQGSPCFGMGLKTGAPNWLTTDFYGNDVLGASLLNVGVSQAEPVVTPVIKSPAYNSVFAYTTTSVLLAWEWTASKPIGIVDYEIEVQRNNGESLLLKSTNTSIMLNNLLPASAYKWRVRGIDGTSFKNWSSWSLFNVPHSGPIYVTPAGTGDGLSWPSALGSIQSAIDAAVYGDTIWVAAGTYKPISYVHIGVSFNLKNGVAIYGGFTGVETHLSQRNWVSNPTVLSGELGDSSSNSDNSLCVIKAIGTEMVPLDSTTRIDGVIVEDGFNNNMVLSAAGGGAYLKYANINVSNSIFRNNYAIDGGAAVYAELSNPVFTNTLFLSNESFSDGGAIHTKSDITLTHCSFINNQSVFYGGAVYSKTLGCKISNSIAWGNSGKDNFSQFYNVSCTYSCVEGGYTGLGNIKSDPLFVDPATGNFRLQPSSPCINKALVANTPSHLTADFDLLPRIIGGSPDMGPLETAYVISMTPGNNQSHTQVFDIGSVIKWDIDPKLPSINKQKISCLYEIWKKDFPATIINKGQGKGIAEVNIDPVDFGTAYQWHIGVITAGHTYWSTPATFFIGRENPIFVKTGGNGNGSSWADALGSVSSALDLANPGDRIWVAAGSYKPTGIGRNATFKLKPYVELLGGFDATDNLVTSRNPEKSVTILSGDLGTAHDDSDNAFHVFNNTYTLSDPLVSAVIDGFTITGGNSGNANGGGMLNVFANPIVRYCKFVNNKAASGGAIANISSSPMIINSLLVRNMASESGGAIYSDITSSPVITNATIAKNTAKSGGGISGNGSVGNTIVYDNIGGQIAGTPIVTYSCVQGGFSGSGNITASPRFKDANNNNYAIGPFSSCFDKGNNSMVTADFAMFDLSFSEIRNYVSSVDIGAYELKHPDIEARVEVTQTTPAHAATNIDYSAPIVLTFNEPSIISDESGITMASGIKFKSMALSDDKRTLTLTPSVYWPFNSSQKLVIASGAIRFADNANFRLLDFESNFDIRSCVPATLSIDLLNPATCPGTLATLTAKTTGDVQLYEWLFNQSLVAIGSPRFSIQKLTADSIGVYYCQVTDMCGNKVSALSEVKFVEGILKPSIVKKWDDVYLVDNSSNRFSNYKWYFDKILQQSVAQYVSIPNSSVGQTIYVTALDISSGCVVQSDEQKISLSPRTIKVSPNPVMKNHSVEVSLPAKSIKTIVRMMDVYGQVVAEQSFYDSDNFNFNNTSFVPGVYLMEFNSDNVSSFVKLIIQ